MKPMVAVMTDTAYPLVKEISNTKIMNKHLGEENDISLQQ
jgi:hypothetical protein